MRTVSNESTNRQRKKNRFWAVLDYHQSFFKWLFSRLTSSSFPMRPKYHKNKFKIWALIPHIISRLNSNIRVWDVFGPICIRSVLDEFKWTQSVLSGEVLWNATVRKRIGISCPNEEHERLFSFFQHKSFLYISTLPPPPSSFSRYTFQN